MNPQFYCVLGNRDHLKVQGDKVPIWEFIDHSHYLTSLAYLKGVERPLQSRMILDCGAWSYKGEIEPRWSPEECLEMYLGFASVSDILASPDHMVLRSHDSDEEDRRIALTLNNARVFLRDCPSYLKAMAVVHGHTIETRMGMLREYLDMGYRHIAIGSVAVQAGNRRFILGLLEEVARLRQQEAFYLHVLGISALSYYWPYVDYGVDSYDGSSMFFSAFTAAEYLWHDGHGALAAYSVKELDAEMIPLCGCAACTAMRREGHDTRQMGSNERNMGRAVHNINQYLAALETLKRHRPEGAVRLPL